MSSGENHLDPSDPALPGRTHLQPLHLSAWPLSRPLACGRLRQAPPSALRWGVASHRLSTAHVHAQVRWHPLSPASCPPLAVPALRAASLSFSLVLSLSCPFLSLAGGSAVPDNTDTIGFEVEEPGRPCGVSRGSQGGQGSALGLGGIGAWGLGSTRLTTSLQTSDVTPQGLGALSVKWNKFLSNGAPHPHPEPDP